MWVSELLELLPWGLAPAGPSFRDLMWSTLGGGNRPEAPRQVGGVSAPGSSPRSHRVLQPYVHPARWTPSGEVCGKQTLSHGCPVWSETTGSAGSPGGAEPAFPRSHSVA